MINTKEELSSVLRYEQKLYVPDSIGRQVKDIARGSLKRCLWRYVKALRKMEYYCCTRNDNFFHNLKYYWYSRRVCNLGMKLGIEAEPGVFDSGLKIYHPAGIVINGDARVGKNCTLHGGNVIGNMGEGTGAPVIGHNVRLGHGAKVLGDVYIADNVQIGAGALVINSCEEKGALLVGVPARIHQPH